MLNNKHANHNIINFTIIIVLYDSEYAIEIYTKCTDCTDFCTIVLKF